MSTTPPSVSHAARRREKAIWQGAAASLVAKGITAVCGLAQVPIAVEYLGGDLFGLWITLTSALTLMAFADLGIGAGVQNDAAAHLGRDTTGEARRTLANGLGLLALIGAGLAVVLVGAVSVLPWQRWLHLVDEAQIAQARAGLLVLVILFCANLPLTGVARLAFGLQLGWLANAWYAGINLLSLLAVAAGSGLKLGFVGFVTLAALPQIVGHACLLAHLLRKMDWRWSELPRPTGGEMMRLLYAGLPFTLPQLSILALHSFPPLVIAAVLGPVEAARYQLCYRLLSLFAVVQHLWHMQLWPAYTEAATRGDVGWFTGAYRKAILGTVALIAAPQAAFALWGPPVVDLWTQGVIAVPTLAALWLGLHTAAISVSQPPAFLLSSYGWMKGQTIYGLVAVGLPFLAMPWALRTWGLAGASMVLIAGWVLVYTPMSYLEAKRLIREVGRGGGAGRLGGALDRG